MKQQEREDKLLENEEILQDKAREFDVKGHKLNEREEYLIIKEGKQKRDLDELESRKKIVDRELKKNDTLLLEINKDMQKNKRLFDDNKSKEKILKIVEEDIQKRDFESKEKRVELK